MECPICWEPLAQRSPTTPTVSVPCGHLFHEACLSPILHPRAAGARGGEPECPICREPIKLNQPRDLKRASRAMPESCYPAVRRVYLTPPDVSIENMQHEIDSLYTRLSQTQESLQKAKQKENSAEERLRTVIDIWKQEQAKNAELERTVRALRQELGQPVAKTAPPSSAPAYVPVPPPPPQAPVSPAVSTDPWHVREQEIVAMAVRGDQVWRMPPPPPVPVSFSPALPPATRLADYHLFHVGPSYQQALPPAPQPPPALQPVTVPLPQMPPPPMASALPHPYPGYAGAGSPYAATGPLPPPHHLHYAPPPMGHAISLPPSQLHPPLPPPLSASAPVPAPVPAPVAQSSRTPAPEPHMHRVHSQTEPSTDPRPRHLTGTARDNAMARIRMQMDRARLQQARYARQASPQGVPGSSQRWGEMT